MFSSLLSIISSFALHEDEEWKTIYSYNNNTTCYIMIFRRKFSVLIYLDGKYLENIAIGAERGLYYI